MNNGWSTYPVPAFTWKGALRGKTSTTTRAARCTLKVNDRCYNFSAYLSEDLDKTVIVGNPIITHYLELIHSAVANKEKRKASAGATVNTLGLIDAANVGTLDTDEAVVATNETFESTVMTIEDLTMGDVEEVFMVQFGPSHSHLDARVHELPAELQEEFKDTVSDKLPHRNPTLTYNHEIELKPGAKPPRLPPYRMTPLLEKECKAIIKEFLEKDFIQESKSRVSSPVLLVKKKDGSYRLVVDYRQLNSMTIKDPFPLPRIDDLMAKIGDCSVFSSLDLHSGYHQIPMDPDSAPLTAFSTPFGHWEFRTMSMGLCNAPATFSRYMQQLLGDLDHTFVYLDDILVASKDRESHVKHLHAVLKRLKDAGLVCKKKKCHFFQSKLSFLGFTISDKGFSVQEDKVKAIQELPMPSSIKAAQSFCGMVNYYRALIPDGSQIARPIFEYISKKCEWSQPQSDAVLKLKELLASPPVLVPFEPGDKYVLTTDASYTAIGAVLERYNPATGQRMGVIGYFSKTVTDTQSRYHIGELELLAIVKSLEHFRYFLHGHKFLLRTDHSSLLSYKNKSEPSQRLARWLQYLEEFDFDIEHVKGKNNAVADALSRPQEIDAIEICPISSIATVNPPEWYPNLLKDPWCAAVLVSLGVAGNVDVSAQDTSLYNKYVKKLLHQNFVNDRLAFFF